MGKDKYQTTAVQSVKNNKKKARWFLWFFFSYLQKIFTKFVL